IAAGARPRLAESVGNLPEQALAQRTAALRRRHPCRVGVIVSVLVTGEAGLVLNRLERLHVAGLALLLQRMMCEAELARAPRGIAPHRRFRIIATRELAEDRE